MGKIKVMTVFGTRPEGIKIQTGDRTDHLCYGTAPSDAGSGTGDFPYCTGI